MSVHQSCYKAVIFTGFNEQEFKNLGSCRIFQLQSKLECSKIYDYNVVIMISFSGLELTWLELQKAFYKSTV